MQTVNHRAPSQLLSSYVNKFSLKELSVPHEMVKPAFEDHFLEFYLQGRYTIIEREGGHHFLSPCSVFIGHQTRHNWNLRLLGSYRMFFIHFTPIGFYRIFNIPMKQLTNHAHDPESLICSEFKALHEQLSNTCDFADMVSLVEGFLLKKLADSKPATDKIDRIVNHIEERNGQVNMDWLIDQGNLGSRQFERKFDAQLGVSPKIFIRKTRLKYAIRLKTQQPQLSWTQLSYQAGYFDQAHMIKDFRYLTGHSPGIFIKTAGIK